jgi:hypothetical protein
MVQEVVRSNTEDHQQNGASTDVLVRTTSTPKMEESTPKKTKT